MNTLLHILTNFVNKSLVYLKVYYLFCGMKRVTYESGGVPIFDYKKAVLEMPPEVRELYDEANDFSMGWEFTWFYLEGLDEGKSEKEAANDAYYEWIK